MTERHFNLLLDGNRRSTYRRQHAMNPDPSGASESVGNRSIRVERKVRFSLGIEIRAKKQYTNKYRRPIRDNFSH